MSHAAEVGQIIGAHIVAALILAIVASVLAWGKSGDPHVIVAVAIVAAVAGVGIVIAVRRIRARTSAPAPLSKEVLEWLVKCAARGSDLRALGDLFVQIHETIMRVNGRPVTIRLDVALYSPELHALTVRCEQFTYCTSSHQVSRVYPITGASPSGSSVAGTAWKLRAPVYVGDGFVSRIYKRFDDEADQFCRPSRTVYSLPIFHPQRPAEEPIAVLSITSPEPDQLTAENQRAVLPFVTAMAEVLIRIPPLAA